MPALNYSIILTVYSFIHPYIASQDISNAGIPGEKAPKHESQNPGTKKDWTGKLCPVFCPNEPSSTGFAEFPGCAQRGSEVSERVRRVVIRIVEPTGFHEVIL